MRPLQAINEPMTPARGKKMGAIAAENLEPFLHMAVVAIRFLNGLDEVALEGDANRVDVGLQQRASARLRCAPVPAPTPAGTS